MTYDFKCPKCGRKETIVCRISEYDEVAKNASCTDCGEKMKQVIEWVGGVNLCGGMYGTSGNGSWNH